MTATAIRPRSATELVDASFQLMRRFYAPLVTLSAIAKFPDVLTRLILRDSMKSPEMMTKAPGAWILVTLIALASFVIAETLLVVAVSDAYLKGEVDIARTIRTGAPRVFTVTIAALIRGLMVFGVCIVCSVPFALMIVTKVPYAPYLMVLLILLVAAYPLLRTFATTAIVMLEGQGASASVGRSFRLTKDFLPHIIYSLGLAFVLTFIITGITAALTLKLLSPALAGIVQALVFIPIYPFAAVVATMLYYDLRIRKEGFDLEVLSRELGTNAAA